MERGMAYRRSNGKSRRRIEPAVQTLLFKTDSTATNSTANYYVDLSQAASLVNRRFYRQGIKWAVSSIKITSQVDCSVTVMKLPETWVMENSYTKGFATWKEMNDKALEMDESVRPKFMDFKVFADADHHELGFGANLLPHTRDSTGAVVEAGAGKWDESEIIIPNVGPGIPGTTTTFNVIATGANDPGISTATGFNAKSLIEGYASSRALPNIVDPNVPDDNHDYNENWMQAVENEGTFQSAEVLLDLGDQNNKAPYPYEGDGTAVDTQYPGGTNQLPGLQIHDAIVHSSTTIGNQSHIKGGMFSCGLLKFQHTVGDPAGNLFIQIDLVPGEHRGYMCEPMLR